jgi:hypothetical protein
MTNAEKRRLKQEDVSAASTDAPAWRRCSRTTIKQAALTRLARRAVTQATLHSGLAALAVM